MLVTQRHQFLKVTLLLEALQIASTLYHSPSLKSEKILRGVFRGKARVQELATKALFIQEKHANAVNQPIKYRKERKKIIFTLKSLRIMRWGKRVN